MSLRRARSKVKAKRLFTVACFAGSCLVAGVGRASPSDLSQLLLEHHYGSVMTTRDRTNHQYVDAKINHRAVHFILDTGAGLTVITADCARRLHLDVHDLHVSSMGAGGLASGSVGQARISSFTINDWEINRLDTIKVLAPSAKIPKADGLLGFDTLCLNRAILVVGGHGFMMRPGALTRVPPISAYMHRAGYSGVPLIASSNRILVNGELDDYPLRAEVDCGAAVSIFSTAYLKKNHLPVGKYLGSFEGVDGRNVPASVFYPRTLELGNYRVSLKMMLTANSPLLTAGNIDALLGFEFLSHFTAVIDTGSGIMWLRAPQMFPFVIIRR